VACYSSSRSGVPRGSVLGPVLFLIFISNIVDIFGSGLNVKLFADDVKMYAIINDVNDSVLLQEGLNHFMHDQTFGNCLFLYKNALFYILVGITLSITIQ